MFVYVRVCFFSSYFLEKNSPNYKKIRPHPKKQNTGDNLGMCFAHGKLTTQRFAINPNIQTSGGGGIEEEREGSFTYFLKSEMEHPPSHS